MILSQLSSMSFECIRVEFLRVKGSSLLLPKTNSTLERLKWRNEELFAENEERKSSHSNEEITNQKSQIFSNNDLCFFERLTSLYKS